MGPEDRFKNRVLRVLKTHGGWWYTTPRSRFTKAGVPDVIGCMNGRFIAIEFKNPDGYYTTTPAQRMNLDHIHSVGGVAFVCDSEQKATEVINYIINLAEEAKRES